MASTIFNSHISWHGIPLPAYVFIFSCLVYIFGRHLTSFLGALISVDGQKTAHPASGLDQAEKGSLKRPEDMSDDELFQLEKRAFFSKVSVPAFLGGDLGLTLSRHGCTLHTGADSRNPATIMFLMWPEFPSLSFWERT